MMRHPLLIVPAVLLAACSGTEPPQPISITLVSGEEQEAIRGTPLPNPIVVRVLGEGDQPFQGAIVTFSVGNFTVGFDTTNADGLAQLVWTLPATVGNVTLSAAVAGLTPVVVPATALDPCLIDHAYVFGTSGSGVLDDVDCLDGGQFFIDYHGFVFPGGAGEFLISSGQFDTWAQIEDADGNIVAVNDDLAQGNTNSRAKVFLADGQDYRFGVTSFSPFEVGNYTMSSANTSTDVTNCEEAWVVIGITLTQSLTNLDCVADGVFADLITLVIQPNQDATVRMTSNAVDARLVISSRFDTLVLEDDNSGGGTDARIVLLGKPDIGQLFDIAAATATAGELGAYTLTVTAGTAGVATRAPSFGRPPARGFVRDRRWPGLLRQPAFAAPRRFARSRG